MTSASVCMAVVLLTALPTEVVAQNFLGTDATSVSRDRVAEEPHSMIALAPVGANYTSNHNFLARTSRMPAFIVGLFDWLAVDRLALAEQVEIKEGTGHASGYQTEPSEVSAVSWGRADALLSEFLEAGESTRDESFIMFRLVAGAAALVASASAMRGASRLSRGPWWLEKAGMHGIRPLLVSVGLVRRRSAEETETESELESDTDSESEIESDTDSESEIQSDTV